MEQEPIYHEVVEDLSIDPEEIRDRERPSVVFLAG